MYISEGSRHLRAESVVAKWRYLWQTGEPHGHDSLHRQDFSHVGPTDPSILSQIPPRHPCPAGRTTRPAGKDVRVSRMVDQADRGAGRHVSGAHLSGHAPDDLSVLARVMRAHGAVAPDLRKPMARAVKKHRRPAWNSSRIGGAHLSSSVPRVRWSVARRCCTRRGDRSGIPSRRRQASSQQDCGDWTQRRPGVNVTVTGGCRGLGRAAWFHRARVCWGPSRT